LNAIDDDDRGWLRACERTQSQRTCTARDDQSDVRVLQPICCDGVSNSLFDLANGVVQREMNRFRTCLKTIKV
jgi:hypothetical protein